MPGWSGVRAVWQLMPSDEPYTLITWAPNRRAAASRVTSDSGAALETTTRTEERSSSGAAGCSARRRSIVGTPNTWPGRCRAISSKVRAGSKPSASTIVAPSAAIATWVAQEP